MTDVDTHPLNFCRPADISDALHLHNIRDRIWQIQACSAKNGTGLQEGIEWCIRTVEQQKKK